MALIGSPGAHRLDTSRRGRPGREDVDAMAQSVLEQWFTPTRADPGVICCACLGTIDEVPFAWPGCAILHPLHEDCATRLASEGLSHLSVHGDTSVLEEVRCPVCRAPWGTSAEAHSALRHLCQRIAGAGGELPVECQCRRCGGGNDGADAVNYYNSRAPTRADDPEPHAQLVCPGQPTSTMEWTITHRPRRDANGDLVRNDMGVPLANARGAWRCRGSGPDDERCGTTADAGEVPPRPGPEIGPGCGCGRRGPTSWMAICYSGRPPGAPSRWRAAYACRTCALAPLGDAVGILNYRAAKLKVEAMQAFENIARELATHTDSRDARTAEIKWSGFLVPWLWMAAEENMEASPAAELTSACEAWPGLGARLGCDPATIIWHAWEEACNGMRRLEVRSAFDLAE